MLTFYTLAPKSYDGFGTTEENEKAGLTCGKHVRKVEVHSEHESWQKGRYYSGGYPVYSPEVWKDLCARGLAHSYE